MSAQRSNSSEPLPPPQPLEVSGPTSFDTAIRYTSSTPIHDAYARAIVLGTDIYYSPNSSRTPPLPPKDVTRPIRDPVKDSVEEFHNPSWWRTDMAYLPFVPTAPQFGTPPFHVLYNEPLETGPRRKRRLRMESNDILSWKRLENTLERIFRSFQSSYSIPGVHTNRPNVTSVPVRLRISVAVHHRRKALSKLVFPLDGYGVTGHCSCSGRGRG